MGSKLGEATLLDSNVETDDLDETLRLQSDLMKRAQKATANIGKANEALRKNRSFYVKMQQKFDDIVAEFESNHRKIVKLVPSADVQTFDYFEKDLCDSFAEQQITFMAEITAMQERYFPEQASPPPPPDPTNSNNNNRHLTPAVNLPPISIPQFSGAPAEWKTFHDIYRSIIHTNVNLSGSHKLHYLLSALRGDAREVIAGFDVCDDNYLPAWKLLKRTYDDKPSMFMHLMNKFTSLKPLDREQPDQLREILKATSSCLKSLSSVGIDKEKVDPIITYLLIRKLPTDTLSHWESTRDRTKMPAFDDVSSCIQTRIRVASVVSTVGHESKPSHSKNSESQTKSNQNEFKAKKKQVKSFHTATKEKEEPTQSSSSSKSTEKKFNCGVCTGENHPLRFCNKFLSMPPAERKATIIRLQYCVNCLAYNHTESKCNSRHTCFTCGEKHHSMLHIDADANQIASHAATVTANESSIERNACNEQNSSISSYSVLLATAIITVFDADKRPHHFRALVDQGSEGCFISESACQSLRLPKVAVQTVITGIGASNGTSKFATSFTMQSPIDKGFHIDVEAYVLNRVTNLLPSTVVQPQRWEHLSDLTLADPSYHRTGRIDIVLGADVFAQIIMDGVRIGPVGSPIAQQTRLGWILSGKISNDSQRRLHISSCHASASIEALMDKFMAIESVNDVSQMSVEEQWCEQFFIDNHRRDENGRFQVRLPFRFHFEPNAKIGRSRAIAVNRLLQLERRFASNPRLKEEYSKSINEYLTAGRMRPTTSSEVERNGHVNSAYLPHHAVFKESSTSTKLRVVFDASRKTTNGKSLNDILLVGPTIQADIVTIILNWRFHRIAFTADVQKMYLQVMVGEDDSEYQRIVWRNDPSEPIQDFALNRLTFGTSSAPYMAIRCVNQLAEYERSQYPEAAEILTNDAYVDDVISGGDDVVSVQKVQSELVKVMKSGGFELKKWASNFNEILQQIPEEDREVKVPVELNANDSIKALGIAWNTASDAFSFKSPAIDATHKLTKRFVLSSVAKLFDPIGLIAPIVVTAKIIMREIWAANPVLEWDDELPLHFRDAWQSFFDDLQHISAIKIPRWINTSKQNPTHQIIGFCDASKDAFGAALYLRTVQQDGGVHVHLIASKSKVAPQKAVTIPRLELCAAFTLASLLHSIRKGLRHVNITNDDVYLFSDSEIVLYWLRSSKPLKVFVANRVVKIHEATIGIRWRHVRTHDNPADLITHGTTPIKLSTNSLWWHGPDWLRLSPSEWPISPIDMDTPPPEAREEYRRFVLANVCTKSTDVISDFSSYNRLVRITARCKRFIHNCRFPHNRIAGPLTVVELQAMRRHWILQVQKQVYFDEYQCLVEKLPLDHRSKLKSLNPFIDGNGILRVSGRLEHSTLPYDEKFPIILPPNHHFTHLLIDRHHLRTFHGGAQLVSSVLRRHYWIVNARRTVQFRIHKCIVCHRQRADTMQQLMGSLPEARVRSNVRPFLHTGVDYCGPVQLRASKGRGIKSYKGYIAVFICLAVKSIHLEIVDGLTADAFLAAFRRFVSRRGLPSDMYSDNGTNFVGASNLITKEKRLAIIECEQQIASKFIEDDIKWHFIPPSSPHFGGLWEAGVKSTKHHLRRVLGEAYLTYEEMSTLLCQIEAALNSRPLCPLSSDPEALAALTPGHFLIGSELVAIPEPSIVDENPHRLTRWQRIQQLKQSFWSRWCSEYLSSLQQRPKWRQEIANIQIGQMVLVKDDRLPSSKWPLGRIIDIHPGEDELVRVVTVRTAAGTFKRNITKISCLPFDDTTTESHVHPSMTEET